MPSSIEPCAVFRKRWRALPSEPRWLTAGEVTRFNQRAVEETGEPFQVRSEHLLESACARPAQHWQYGERNMGRLAGFLLLGIAQNHPFAQGNKRAALVAADAFLHIHHYRLHIPDTHLADLILDTLKHKRTAESFLDLFAKRSLPVRARGSQRRYPRRKRSVA